MSTARVASAALYDPDMRRPSLHAADLAGAAMHAALYRKSPVGLPAAAGIDARKAQLLQETAWATTREYSGR